MTLETGIIILAVGVLAVLVVLRLRRPQGPKPRTQRLAMTVWASFGPYETAEEAEKFLRRASRVVFGAEGVTEHEAWIEGHVNNFRDWEEEGRFAEAHKMMCAGLGLTASGPAFEAAFNEVKAELVTQVQEGTEWMNKEFLEGTGHKLEAVKQPDGTVQFLYKQTWSDEEIQQKEQKDSEAMLNAVGHNLLKDESPEARQLLAFLSVVYEKNMDKDLDTPKDIGKVWFACFAAVNEEPDSEMARTFKVLNDAWAATIPDSEA